MSSFGFSKNLVYALVILGVASCRSRSPEVSKVKDDPALATVAKQDTSPLKSVDRLMELQERAGRTFPRKNLEGALVDPSVRLFWLEQGGEKLGWVILQNAKTEDDKQYLIILDCGLDSRVKDPHNAANVLRNQVFGEKVPVVAKIMRAYFNQYELLNRMMTRVVSTGGITMPSLSGETGINYEADVFFQGGGTSGAQGVAVEHFYRSIGSKDLSLSEENRSNADPIARAIIESAFPNLRREMEVTPLNEMIGENIPPEIANAVYAVFENTDGKNRSVGIIGEAGGGKTTAAKFLLHQIILGQAPEKHKELIEKRLGKNYGVLEFSSASMKAGTSYRGQFEERLKKLIELCKIQPQVVLWDEFHMIPDDVSQEIKGLMAEGKLLVIGLTTQADIEDTQLEKDLPFRARFEFVKFPLRTKEEIVKAVLSYHKNLVSRGDGVRFSGGGDQEFAELVYLASKELVPNGGELRTPIDQVYSELERMTQLEGEKSIKECEVHLKKKFGLKPDAILASETESRADELQQNLEKFVAGKALDKGRIDGIVTAMSIAHVEMEVGTRLDPSNILVFENMDRTTAEFWTQGMSEATGRPQFKIDVDGKEVNAIYLELIREAGNFFNTGAQSIVFLRGFENLTRDVQNQLIGMLTTRTVKATFQDGWKTRQKFPSVLYVVNSPKGFPVHAKLQNRVAGEATVSASEANIRVILNEVFQTVKSFGKVTPEVRENISLEVLRKMSTEEYKKRLDQDGAEIYEIVKIAAIQALQPCLRTRATLEDKFEQLF